MDSLQTLRLSNIKSLHNSIDTASRVGIEQKGELVKDLNRKKQVLINSIQDELSQCRDVERSLYNKLSNTSTTESYSKLEEYNLFLKEQHDKGSELIGNINAAKNFQQINQVEMTLLNPFLNNLRSNCSVYVRHTAFTTRMPMNPVTVAPVSTEIKTTGLGKTDIGIHHTTRGTDVDVAKEGVLGSPAHSVHVSSAKGPVRVTHQPSPQPVRTVSAIRPVVAVPVAPVLVQPVQAVQAVQVVRPVTPVRVVRPVVHVQPVTPIRQVIPVRPVVPVQHVVPVQPVSPVVHVQPFRQVIPVQPVSPVVHVQPVSPVVHVQPVAVVPVRPVFHSVQPVHTVAVASVATIPRAVGTRAIVTHDYIPRSPDRNKLSLRAGTEVIIDRYNGDWALVNTSTGQRGYVSKHYLRNY